MAINYVEQQESYDLPNSPTPITFEASIGDGQPGSYSFFLGSKSLGNNDSVTVNSSELKSARLTLVASITDEREETNHTSLTLRINEKICGPYEKKVEAQGDIVIYTVVVNFEG